MTTSPFNESPAPYITPTHSSSIETRATDPYRQGVELTMERHFHEGPVKIHAGEPGHQLRPNNVGEQPETLFPNARFFQEIDVFDPVLYLSGNIRSEILSGEVALRASTTTDGLSFDGTIEPFTIRSIVTFRSGVFAEEPHAFRGNVESANFNTFVHADRIVSVQRFNEVTYGLHPYDDKVNSVNELPVNELHVPIDTRLIRPFDDAQLKSGQYVTGSMPSEMQDYLKQMNPDTENYVPFGNVKSVTGFDD
jgi:hypothetical protein